MRKIFYLLVMLVVLDIFNTRILSATVMTATYQEFEDEHSVGQAIGETVITFEDISDNEAILNRQKQYERCLTHDNFVLDRDYAVTKWTRVCPEEGTDFTAEREGNVLKIQGKQEGAIVDKEIELGFKPIYIYPKYSLSKFALSGMREMEFWTLRRDKLSKLPMRARKEGVETIVLNGKEVEAIKVFYSIEGKLREKQYYRYYFFRKSDGMYIKKIEPKGKIELLIKEGH